MGSIKAFCVDSRECFGKIKDLNNKTRCDILRETYVKDGECPFCKPEREYTNGVFYPYDDPKEPKEEPDEEITTMFDCFDKPVKPETC